MIFARLIVPLCAIAIVGCGSNAVDDVAPDSSGDVSSGMDAGKDSGKQDATMDAKADVSIDAGHDSSPEEDSSIVDASDDADDADANDGGPPPPMDASLCKVNFGFGSVSMQGCSSGENWTCGNDTYEFECFCPGATCACKKNGQGVMKVQSPNGCPNCGFNAAQIAGLCNFPY